MRLFVFFFKTEHSFHWKLNFTHFTWIKQENKFGNNSAGYQRQTGIFGDHNLKRSHRLIEQLISWLLLSLIEAIRLFHFDKRTTELNIESIDAHTGVSGVLLSLSALWKNKNSSQINEYPKSDKKGKVIPSLTLTLKE